MMEGLATRWRGDFGQNVMSYIEIAQRRNGTKIRLESGYDRIT